MTSEKGRRMEQAMKTTAGTLGGATGSEAQTVIDVDTAAPRPLAVLAALRKINPDAWEGATHTESWRGTGADLDWPEWCYLPTGASMGLIALAISASKGETLKSVADVRRAAEEYPLGATLGSCLISALAAWRMTKGVYRFDPDVLRALWSETERPSKVPVEILRRLPEWCPYMEIPEGFDPGEAEPQLAGLQGFWAFLDYGGDDAGESRITFVLDLGKPFPNEDALREGSAEPSAVLNFGSVRMPLVADTVEGAAEAVVSEGLRTTEELEGEDAASELRERAHQIATELRSRLAPLLNTTLYLCAANAEIAAADDSERRPGNPVPKRTKKRGEKLFAAEEVREWNVAFRVGAALRRARSETDAHRAEIGAGGRRVRAHVRRAHWHTFWTGPRSGEQTPILKWLPPTPVNVDDADELPAVVR
ncbi:MAG: hypothetical protein M3Q49_05935, partial [Actinomycetota bacterium]|nr:hypothetical protein [Actinomycetota bacterium]